MCLVARLCPYPLGYLMHFPRPTSHNGGPASKQDGRRSKEKEGKRREGKGDV